MADQTCIMNGAQQSLAPNLAVNLGKEMKEIFIDVIKLIKLITESMLSDSDNV